jgi:hypothetical protein
MNLTHLQDQELLDNIKNLAQTERTTLTKILHHLREIDRRRLYSDLGCASLFDYAVRHLQYSEGQAGRRIQAMRLLREIPEIEAKIESGALTLSNICQAQSFFRDVSHTTDDGRPKILAKDDKVKILGLLENKTARDATKELLAIGGDAVIPKERERIIDDEHSEVRFVMDQGLREKLEEVRSLLGPEGAGMSLAALVARLADVGVAALRAKKFGKQRSEQVENGTDSHVRRLTPTPTSELCQQSKPRYISRELKHLVWQRDKGACTSCGTRRGLNFDHITPVAHGGESKAENLRLLCFHCNQRAGIRLGVIRMKIQHTTRSK